MEEAQDNSFLFNISKLPIEQVVNNLFASAFGTYYSTELERVIRYIIECGYRFTTSDEFEGLKTEVSGSGLTFAHALARYGYAFTILDLISLGNLQSAKGKTIAEEMEKHDNIFRISDFASLVPPVSLDALFHVLARRGYYFRVDELLKMGNPAENTGWTVAHEMTSHGFIFQLSELLALGNPATTGNAYKYGLRPAGWTVAHNMASNRHSFTMEELGQLGNPAAKNGRTIAHEMASNGYKFNASDLIALGNPVDHQGWSVAHLMAIHGYSFHANELSQLGNPAGIKAAEIKNLHLTYQDEQPVFADGGKLTNEIVFSFGKRDERDFTVPEVSYTLSIKECETGWMVDLDVTGGNQYTAHIQKAKVEKLRNALNHAMSQVQIFDFAELLKYWTACGEHFSMTL